jgi:hypothetical protein
MRPETETKTADGAVSRHGLNVVVNGRLQERAVDQVAALFSRTPIPQVEQRHDKKQIELLRMLAILSEP